MAESDGTERGDELVGPDRPTGSPELDDTPVLPSVTRDEQGEGWGDERDGGRDAEWYRRETPPHHG